MTSSTRPEYSPEQVEEAVLRLTIMLDNDATLGHAQAPNMIAGHIRTILSALAKAEDSRDEWQRTANAFASDVVGYVEEIALMRVRLESAERERDLMRPVVLHARRWYHTIGTDHDLGVEVPRYENLTAHSPTPTQDGTNG